MPVSLPGNGHFAEEGAVSHCPLPPGHGHRNPLEDTELDWSKLGDTEAQ